MWHSLCTFNLAFSCRAVKCFHASKGWDVLACAFNMCVPLAVKFCFKPVLQLGTRGRLKKSGAAQGPGSSGTWTPMPHCYSYNPEAAGLSITGWLRADLADPVARTSMPTNVCFRLLFNVLLMVCQCTRLFHIERLRAVWWTARHVQFSSRVHVDSAARRFGFGGFSLLNCCSVCVCARPLVLLQDRIKMPRLISLHNAPMELPASSLAVPSTPARVQHVVAPRSVRRSPCLSSAAEHWRPELVMMTALFVGIAEKRRFRLPAVALSAKKEGKETKKAKDAFSNKIRTFFGRVYALFSLPFGGAGNFAQVDQGSVGVVLRFGKFDRMLDPGRHQFNVAVEKVMIVPLTLDKSWQALNFHSRILRSKFGKSIKSQSTLVKSRKLRSWGRFAREKRVMKNWEQPREFGICPLCTSLPNGFTKY